MLQGCNILIISQRNSFNLTTAPTVLIGLWVAFLANALFQDIQTMNIHTAHDSL